MVPNQQVCAAVVGPLGESVSPWSVGPERCGDVQPVCGVESVGEVERGLGGYSAALVCVCTMGMVRDLYLVKGESMPHLFGG